jgi:putative monooxygenase
VLCLVLPLMLVAAPPTPPAGAVVERADQPIHVIAEGKGGARVLLDSMVAPGLREAAMTELVMLPGAVVAEHAHDRSAELLYILEGTGTMQLGDRTIEVKPGMAIFIPAGMKHALRVDTKIESLRALQIYTPGGPEQRFKQGAAAKN